MAATEKEEPEYWGRSRRLGWFKRKEEGKYEEEKKVLGKRLRMWKEKGRSQHLPFPVVFLRLLLQEIMQISDL